MPFLDEYVRQSQASPSVALEKGAYRLRSTRRNTAKSTPLRARAHSRASSNPPTLHYEKQMALLVVLLICATVTCFGTAYYLFTTSGFHNQRIAFENALVLARLLNRTLLVPPARLGNAFLYYSPFDELQEMLVQSDKRLLQHCRETANDYDVPEECVDFDGYTQVPWDWLVDLSDIQQHQKFLVRRNFTDEWLYDALAIEKEDIFSLPDTSRDMYGFQDFDPLSTASGLGRKYQYMIHLSTLSLREEPLIYLGSLFGSSRLHLRDARNLDIRKYIRQNMARLNPMLLDVATSVQRALGAPYIGAHIRLGDGIFEENAAQNSRLAWWKIVHGVLGLPIDDTLAIERRFGDIGLFESLDPPESILGEWERPTLHMPTQAGTSTSTLCKNRLHTDSSLLPLNTPLFISSDASEPWDDPHLALFTRSFPCTFFLSDFPDHTAHLHSMINSLDGLSLQPFLMPFVDALVVARGIKVVGTEGKRMNTKLWYCRIRFDAYLQSINMAELRCSKEMPMS
ncbi:hypothetical protein BC629DRAFT_352373 [Irpex lacteus]|nr:hypothetical protein BC629DRAFT_352373 [Irpex lacteus]